MHAKRQSLANSGPVPWSHVEVRRSGTLSATGASSLPVSEHGHAHLRDSRFTKGTARLVRGRSGRQHVINQQDPYLRTFHSNPTSERTADILSPFGRRLRDLRRSGANAGQEPGDAGDSEGQSHPAGERFRLIIPTLPTLAPMKWDWHDRGRIVSKKCFATSRGPELAEGFRERFAGGMFHPQNRIAKRSLVRSEPHGRLEPEAFVFAPRTPLRRVRVRPHGGRATRTGFVRIGQNRGSARFAKTPRRRGFGKRHIANEAVSRPDQFRHRGEATTSRSG